MQTTWLRASQRPPTITDLRSGVGGSGGALTIPPQCRRHSRSGVRPSAFHEVTRSRQTSAGTSQPNPRNLAMYGKIARKRNFT